MTIRGKDGFITLMNTASMYWCKPVDEASLFVNQIAHLIFARIFLKMPARNILLLVSTLLIGACHSHRSYQATTIGQEEDLIKKGDMRTHITLNTLQGKPHLYALGTVTNLKGFVVIDDSHPFTSFVSGDAVKVDTSWNTEVSLLVYAQVKQWKVIPVPAGIHSRDLLEQFVLEQARANGIDPYVAFPFLLKGTAASLTWRVTDWDPADKTVTNKKIVAAGIHGTTANVRATFVGFYCINQYRVLADHHTKMHLHFCSDDMKSSGHVDAITLDGRMALLLPVE